MAVNILSKPSIRKFLQQETRFSNVRKLDKTSEAVLQSQSLLVYEVLHLTPHGQYIIEK